MERCCCYRVRTGCLIVGALALIGSILAIGRDAKEIMEETTDDMSDEELQLVMNHLKTDNMAVDQGRSFLKTDYYMTIADLFLSIAMVIISGLLIYGVHREIAGFLVPILVLVPIDFLVRLTFVCVYSINLGFLHPISIAMNFNCSIWICFFSHWQQIKDGLDGQEVNEMHPV